MGCMVTNTIRSIVVVSEMNIPKGVLNADIVQRVLHHFIDKLDRQGTRISLSVSKSLLPELFDFSRDDIDYLWSLIEDLEKHYHLLTIKLPKASSNKEIYEGARIIFNTDKEILVRQWLQRPQQLSAQLVWENAVAQYTHRLTLSQRSFLQANRLSCGDKTAFEVVGALCHIGRQLQRTAVALSCRTLSARSFKGDSKCLEHKEDYLGALFPEHQHRIKPRPLLLLVAIPERYNQVLFIENQESFLMLAAEHTHRLIAHSVLVYTAGFRAAATRINIHHNVAFAVHNPITVSSMRCFQRWWHSDAVLRDYYFWGDLDYSGMGILASMRQIYPALKAWQPGYQAMLRYHNKGLGHAPSEAKKQAQHDPGITGCDYVDQQLLPLLRLSQRFLDQEIIAGIDECNGQ